MRTKLFLFLLCFSSISMMAQDPITREKCKICGKVLSQCNGHKKPTPEKKTSRKMCDICEKPLSRCEYGGDHPKCSVCNMLVELCEFRGKHPKCETCGEYMSDCQYNGGHGIINGHEWVDLGLPSGTKWATMNVGASSPSDYGNYYAWGEVKTKAKYDWDNCFDCLDSNGKNWETYKVGGLTAITPSSGHDAARENWGEKWRMPTRDELNELRFECDWTWIVMDGHSGYLVTAPNGNSIFLPAAGGKDGAEIVQTEETGWYLSNELRKPTTVFDKDSSIAFGIAFNNSRHSHAYAERKAGFSIRPVME